MCLRKRLAVSSDTCYNINSTMAFLQKKDLKKESTKKELEASADAIKLKHGLEKALNHITQDPNNAVPDEFS